MRATKKTVEKMSRVDFMQKRLDWSPLEALGLKRQWIDGDLFVTLDEARRAVIRLDTHGIVDNYEALIVRVLNKREGEVDRKTFAFSECLRDVARTDNRQRDCPHERFVVLSYCSSGFDWHIAVPETTVPLTEAVAAYVALFV